MRFKVAFKEGSSNELLPIKYRINPSWIIWDTKYQCPLPAKFDDELSATTHCKFLNKLNQHKEDNKPKPLKEEILKALEEIPVKDYEMLNKIKRQKEHIKTLEHRIKLLKTENHSLQRSYCRISTELQHCKDDMEFYKQEYYRQHRICEE